MAAHQMECRQSGAFELTSVEWVSENGAAKIIEQMEKEGIVSHANHVGKRHVLIPRRSGEE